VAMMAICFGDVIDSEQPQEPFGKVTAPPNEPLQHLASQVIAGPQNGEPERGAEEWQDRLRSLEQWVCELLIKNQRIRMALELARAQEEERPDAQSI
jgi:hypothetical protein